ncbi:MAG: hypothetical protein AAF747_01500 [Planctomycetota bacterium]
MLPRHALGPLALLIALAALVFPGCRVFGTSAGVRVESLVQDAALRPQSNTIAYTSAADNDADIYITDLSPDQLNQDPATLTGNVIHIRMFLRPRPSRTPIERTAVNATVRHAVLSCGPIGIYSGGGFLLPRGKPGGKHFSGGIEQASLRLARATPGFADLLGRSDFEAGFRAPNDPELAARFEDFLSRASFETLAVAENDAPLVLPTFADPGSDDPETNDGPTLDEANETTVLTPAGGTSAPQTTVPPNPGDVD